MKTEHLEYFVDLVDTQSMSKTAEKYYTSHQVIKKAITHLEDELNVPLIHTSNQGVTYSDAGAVLYRKALDILNNVRELQTELQPFQKTATLEKYAVSISLTPYLTEDMILKSLNEYQLNHSEMDIRIRSCSVKVGIDSVKTEHDVFIMPSIPEAVCELEDTLTERNLEAKMIASSKLYVVASTKSDWARARMFYEKEMQHVPLLLPANQSYYTDHSSGSLHSDQVVNSVESLKNLVGMNVGVGLITQKEFDYYFADEKRYALVPTDISDVNYYAVLCKDKVLSREMKSLLKMIANQF